MRRYQSNRIPPDGRIHGSWTPDTSDSDVADNGYGVRGEVVRFGSALVGGGVFRQVAIVVGAEGVDVTVVSVAEQTSIAGEGGHGDDPCARMRRMERERCTGGIEMIAMVEVVEVVEVEVVGWW